MVELCGVKYKQFKDLSSVERGCILTVANMLFGSKYSYILYIQTISSGSKVKSQKSKEKMFSEEK